MRQRPADRLTLIMGSRKPSHPKLVDVAGVEVVHDHVLRLHRTSSDNDAWSRARRLCRIPLAIAAAASLVYGVWFTTRVDEYQDTTHRVTDVLPVGSGEMPYKIALSDGSHLLFNNPPAVSVGDSIGIRSDALGRLRGTIRDGRFIENADPPSRTVFYIPLALSACFSLLVGYLFILPEPWRNGLAARVTGGGRAMMDRMAMPRRDSTRRRRAVREPGVTTWRTRQELVSQWRRYAWATGGLAGLEALIVLSLFQTTTSSAFIGGIFVVALLAIPLILVAFQLRVSQRLLRRARTLDASTQAADAAAHEKVERALTHLARLITRLSPGPLRSAAEESFGSAVAVGQMWTRQLHLAAELESLLELTSDTGSRHILQASVSDCREKIGLIQSEVEELTAAVAALIAASDDELKADIARVDAAGVRVTMLAVALDEMNEVEDV